MDRKVLRNLSYGVYVVTSKKDDKKVGCIANSIMQITSNPATITISINHDNYTNSIIKETNKFAISILKENSDTRIIGEFGFKTSKDVDKFENIDYKEVLDIPVINDSCGFVICNVKDIMETETHTVFLGEVVEADDYNEEKPLTYKYYHENLKGTSPKNAPTYEEKVEEVKTTEKKTRKWKCKVCGYVYEGEEMPEDFVCPICGEPASEFYEIEE